MNQSTQQFDQQAKAAAAALVNILTAITPLFLVVAILGVATVNGYLEYVHYSVVIGSAAWVPGFIFASIRFGSGLGGIHLFKTGQTMRGLFFLLVSVGLTFWTSSHAGSMAVSIALTPGQEDNARILIQTALWVALIGEVMIATYMGAHHDETAQRAPATKPDETAQLSPATAPQRVPQQVTATPRATSIITPPQRNGDEISNVAPIAAEQPETEQPRNQIGFRTHRNAVANNVTPRQRKPRRNSLTLAEQLEVAKRNVRAQRSKLNRGIGTPETVQLRLDEWSSEVERLKAQLTAQE